MTVDPVILEDFGQIAEIAATMAGFAAVAGVIERSRAEVSAYRASNYLVLLATTIPLMVLALLPAWFVHLLSTENSIWRACFGAFVFIQVLTFGMYFFLGGLAAPPATWPRPIRLLMMIVGGIFNGTGFLVTVVALAATFGYFANHHPQLYYSTLMFLLIVAGVNFVALMARHDRTEAVSEPDSSS